MQATAKVALNSLVEEHLTSLVREAVTVQRHSKRARFHPNSADNGGADEDEAAREGILRRRLQAQDINLALQWRGSEKLYGTPMVVPTAENSTKKVDLNEYVKKENTIPPPSEVGLTMHWLAVDGKQPNIPQNPASVAYRNHPSVVHPVVEDDVAAAASGEATAEDSSPDANTKEGVRVRQLLPRLLSEELHLYFTRIALAVEKGGATPQDRQTQDAALERVACDSGLQELVPFFVQYLSQNLLDHVGHPEHCRTLIRLTRSLLWNPYLHLELHLHQLLPSLITSVVAKALSSKSTDNHWALRREAAQVLLQACDLFGDEYVTLKSRVLQTLVEATLPHKSLATQFGGMVGINLFGPAAVDAFMVPLAIPYWKRWESALQMEHARQTAEQQEAKAKPLSLAEQTEIHECEQALLNGMATFLRRMPVEKQAERVNLEELSETFGEKLVPLAGLATDYTTCIV